MGDPPALKEHMPSPREEAEQKFENVRVSGDQFGAQQPDLESVSQRPPAPGEEPVLGDPPSREDSLLGHMPSANPMAEKQFEDAIATVSGDQPGARQRLEPVSEGAHHTEQSQSRDGDSAVSNEAR